MKNVELVKYNIDSTFPKDAIFEDEFSNEVQSVWVEFGKKGCIYVAYVDREPIGYVMYDNQKWIRGFFIKNTFRGKGYGTYILNRVCSIIEDDIIKVNITTGAESIYIREGFIILGPRKDIPKLIVAYKGKLNDIDYKEMISKLE